MKTEFSRKELIYNTVEEIRASIECAKEELKGNSFFKRRCHTITSFISNLGVISIQDEKLLRTIINREFAKISKEEGDCATSK